MLHAGVLMKLGGYGCFRIAMYLMPEAANELSWIFLILTGISVVYGAFSACVQTDLKYIKLIHPYLTADWFFSPF
jgi:NDH_I_M: proton-translocating NADH-quinone oxidoreductase, chain M